MEDSTAAQDGTDVTIVRGNPTPEELAAVIAVIALLRRRAASEAARAAVPPAWTDGFTLTLRPVPGARATWRTSTHPH
ncbi:acyl-CoA carboxylase subunit epsilon [Planotetraspora sp. A-T 1434]|uniref:acyl-CoA carboxylase subunit epsilon n=1 Tax=Planotetraspora sp. A-T 1434 TaxID=2979219 RepID=UPI0021C22FF6|nr:acyl-CoA carboxylase subunit epsilon [Planotetraspora sp. A-T 1434]MCT9933232.1 acyl-CoA carboxylase subunit epsilon [Planotetraspora sp. A-T 1434]